jgi:hypothetical protein
MRVLGVPVPRRRGTNVKGIAKQVAGMAEQLEKKSADVSKAQPQVPPPRATCEAGRRDTEPDAFVRVP